MNRKKRSFWLLIVILLSFISLVYLIFNYPPSTQIILPLEILAKWGITNYQLPIVILFFILLFIFLSSLLFCFLRNLRRSILIGLLSIIYLISRMFYLDIPYFLPLLLALFISLELFFKKHI